MRFLIAVWLVALCLALPLSLRAEDDWHTILHQIGHAVAEAIDQSDNYICAQDLSRFYYTQVKPEITCRQPPELPAVPMLLQDRLKLDVAVSQGSEIYSWHGEHKFSASTVGEVVRQGPISSGSFNGYLRNIFGERGVDFQFKGRSKSKGIELFDFDYQVPLAASHYQIQEGIKGFERTFPWIFFGADRHVRTLLAGGDGGRRNAVPENPHLRRGNQPDLSDGEDCRSPIPAARVLRPLNWQPQRRLH
jgi:hypothetical protein